MIEHSIIRSSSSSSSSSSRRPQVREELAGLPLNSGHRFRNLSSLQLNTSTDPDSTISSGSLFQSFAIRLSRNVSFVERIGKTY